jgi:hypothetical protein
VGGILTGEILTEIIWLYYLAIPLGMFVCIPGSPMFRVVLKQELSSIETPFTIHSNILC